MTKPFELGRLQMIPSNPPIRALMRGENPPRVKKRVVKFLRTAQMTLRTAQMTMRTAQMTMQELYGNRDFTAKELYSPEIFDTSSK